jgi:predicted Zn-dependent protease
MKRVATVVIVTGAMLALAPALRTHAQESPLFSAMQDEMKRSMAELRLKGEPAPYFIEYEIDDVASMRAIARLGGVVDDLTGHQRTLRVQVRVGDYAFDSSRFVTQNNGPAGVVPLADAGVTTPLDDNYDVLRRQIWLTTDAAYKRAVSVYAKKTAAFQNRAAAAVNLADFSREKAVETILPVVPPTTGGREWVERAQQLSSVFTATAGLDTSEVWLSEARGTGYYLNSEGFKVVAPITVGYLRVTADAQAADGMNVRDAFTIVERRLQDMPAMATLTARARELAARVLERRAAEIGDEFTGPVLLEGQASAELLRQSLVPLMLARRPADAEAGGRGAGPAQATPFLTRIGLRVLSDSFSVSDTPSLKQFDGRSVAGAYVVDDEAVPAKDVALVEKGRLLTLLTGRTPQRNLPQSNGHGRSGSVQPGVFQVQSTQAVPASELKAKYLELLKVQDKPFGYIVRAVAAPGDVQTTGPGGPVLMEAVKVTPDGKEEPVRGLRFGAVPSTVFRDILEASQERTLYNYRLDALTLASVIAPNLIFEELEIQRTRDILQKPPIVPSPLP